MKFTDFRVKFNNFFKNRKNIIYLSIIALAIIIAVNIFLGKLKEIEPPSTSYEPHKPIISGSEVKSSNIKEKIETSIDEYMKYCNEKKYEEAYNFLTEDCKEFVFEGNIDNFKKYIDYIFDGNKIYSIQDYSNKDNSYIYQVSILEDIMATGKNTEQSDEIYQEKIVITKDGGNYNFSINGFIKKEDLENVSEDDNMKIYLTQKVTYYDKIIYTINIKNKTDGTILLERDHEENCIGISLEGDNRNQITDDYSNSEKFIYAGKTKTFELTFPKYFDESKNPTSIILNKVRILEKYTGVDSLWEEESKHISKEYSATISL